jgi:hypothetical protein
MIQKQMQFDGPPGSAKIGIVKEADTETNNGGIEPHQFVLKSKLFIDLYLALASFEELHKDYLVELLGPILIGISQSGANGGADAQMFQFAFTASQLSGNLSKRMSSTQLTEEHGHKLTPASKTSVMAFSFCFRHGLLKLDTRKQL